MIPSKIISTRHGAMLAAGSNGSKNYLSFTAEQDNSTISLSAATSPDIKYSLNEGEWTQWDYSAIALNTGDTVRMKGNNGNGFSTSDSYNQFQMTGKIGASGNIMSLLYEDDFEGKLTIPGDYCYYNMFYGCKSLTTAPELPATTLTDSCYRSMFRSCKSLTTAPELPAMTLAANCYLFMFDGCSALTIAPEILPAMTLAEDCYRAMFNRCSSLTIAPELPANTLADSCYVQMFWGCTKLNYIKMLATNINNTYDYFNSWVGNVASTGTFIKHPDMTSLPTGSNGIPEGWIVINNTTYLMFAAEEDNSTISLNAPTSPDIKYSLNGGDWTQWDYSDITLNTGDTVRMKGNNGSGFSTEDDYNYFNMTGKIGASGNIMSLLYEDDFEGKLTIPSNAFNYLFEDCVSLTTAPELPAMTLANDCYSGMFYGCTSLTVAPELPAMTLADSCYYYMFSGCTSLTVAPELPAMTLADGCYTRMFDECTSLITAPELPATTLVNSCYLGMFSSCSSLTTAPELPAMTLADKCYNYMFMYCTKLNYIKMLATDISASDCLKDWVKNVASTGKFVKHPDMTSLPAGTSGIPEGWVVKDIATNYLAFTAEEDNSTISLDARTSPDIKYSLNEGEWTQWDYSAITLNTGDTVRMKGNNSNGFNTNTSSYNRFKMTGKIGASGNIMSLLYEDDFEGKLTIPCDCCYYRMFEDCTSLTTSPELPATMLTKRCYDGMFQGCTSLTVAPELPATTLAESCYDDMFYGCTSLTTSPELPATTLASSCYYRMFEDCTSLTTAPELPATTLASSCYYRMFEDCTSLTTAPELPATTLASSCYNQMFYSCTSLTTAPELPATTLASSCYNHMFEDCTSLTTAPELPATTLADSCYYGMFYSCTSLTTAPQLPATTLASSCYQEMFYGCTSLTTAPELPATTLAEDCYQCMFDTCYSLTESPILPAEILEPYCYFHMFWGCTSLNKITMLAKDISADECMTMWTGMHDDDDNEVSAVSPIGTFVKNVFMNSLPTGTSGIPSGWTVKDNATLLDCASLEITADDVSGRQTNTTIYYTARVNALTETGESIIVTKTGTAVSDEFPQNTSETDTVERTISFTYMGVTATTTITQGVWVNKRYTITLNDNWQLSNKVNPDSSLYDGVYESYSNKGVNSTAATMYIDIVGYTDFDLYIRSYAESNYDYVMVSQLDQTINNNTSYKNSTLVKAHTRGKQNSGSALSNYTLVQFTGIDGGSHRITIVYRKDGSSSAGEDKGYVLIPKSNS